MRFLGTFYLSLMLLIFFLSSCQNDIVNEFEEDFEFDDDEADARCGIGYISNANFERPVNFNYVGTKRKWIKQGYILNSDFFAWGSCIGRNGSGGISVEAPVGSPNDLAATLKINVAPSKFYRLHAWVRTENIVDGHGANICIYDTWSNSGPLTGTNDWRTISFEFQAPATGEVTIGCRLGYWAGVSTGKAYFDDIWIEEVPKFVKAGEHIQLVLDTDDASVVRPNTLKGWIVNLDKAYNAFYELMGEYPYNGETITILSVDSYPGGWAVAGNPILWYKPYISGELRSIEQTGNWSFGILHELGHDFVLPNTNTSWICHEEMFANFRAYYVIEKLNASIALAKFYVGAELKNFYKSDETDSYDNGIGKGIPTGQNGLMYTLIRIKDQIGWEPFISAIRDLNHSNVSPDTHWQRFNLFLDKLSEYSGQDVRKTYPPGELNVIQQLLSQ